MTVFICKSIQLRPYRLLRMYSTLLQIGCQGVGSRSRTSVDLMYTLYKRAATSQTWRDLVSFNCRYYGIWLYCYYKNKNWLQFLFIRRFKTANIKILSANLTHRSQRSHLFQSAVKRIELVIENCAIALLLLLLLLLTVNCCYCDCCCCCCWFMTRHRSTVLLSVGQKQAEESTAFRA